MSTLDLSAVPALLADRLNIEVFAGQILSSVILICIFVFPIVFLRRNNQSPVSEMLVGTCLLGVCVAIEWLPSFFLLLFVLLIALMFAGKARGFLTGE